MTTLAFLRAALNLISKASTVINGVLAVLDSASVAWATYRGLAVR